MQRQADPVAQGSTYSCLAGLRWMLVDQLDMFLARTKAGPYFTRRRTTLNPSSLKYGRLVCTRPSCEVHSCRKSRLNKNPLPLACFWRSHSQKRSWCNKDTNTLVFLQLWAEPTLEKDSGPETKDSPVPPPSHHHRLTFSGSSLRSPRCSSQDPSCGGEEATESGCCFLRGRSVAAPPSVCLWLPPLLLLRLLHPQTLW